MDIQKKKEFLQRILLERRKKISREWLALPYKERSRANPHETWRRFLKENGIKRASKSWDDDDVLPPFNYDYKKSMEEGYWRFGGKKWLLENGTPAFDRNHIIIEDPVWIEWIENGQPKNEFFSRGNIENKRTWGLKVPKEFAMKVLVLQFA